MASIPVTDDLYLGRNDRAQIMLAYIHQKASRKFCRKRIIDVEWPPKHQLNRAVITKIEIHDQGPPAWITIAGGGIGTTFVNFLLKSKRCKKLDFLIKIYGKQPKIRSKKHSGKSLEEHFEIPNEEHSREFSEELSEDNSEDYSEDYADENSGK